MYVNDVVFFHSHPIWLTAKYPLGTNSYNKWVATITFFLKLYIYR